MKLHPSIYGGAIVRDLFLQLTQRPDMCAFKQARGGQVTFRLRNCYRGDEITGSLLFGINQVGANAAGGRGWEQSYRLRAGQGTHLLNNRATLWLRLWANESARQAAVTLVDKAAAPHIENDAFLAWVDRQEAVVGESRYDLMSREQANAWVEGIRAWEKDPAAAYVVKVIEPEGRA